MNFLLINYSQGNPGFNRWIKNRLFRNVPAIEWCLTDKYYVAGYLFLSLIK